jgi:flagellar motility protein MotE (MotC chaperone)
MKRVPLPRLLPVTISMLAVLLVVKTGILVKAALTDGHYVDTAVVTQANAAGQEGAEAKKPANMASPPLSPPPSGAPVAAESSAAIAKGPPPLTISDSEKALLQDLRRRRGEIDARESALASRESLLIASQKTLDERVAELQGLRKGLEDLDAARRQRQEDGWQGLVKVYEAMKPRDAATIFNDLSMPVLLQVLNRMKEAKAAVVMAAMSPEKAREVTAELAQLRTGGSGSTDSRPALPASPPQLSAPRPAPATSPPPAQATVTKASPTGG